MPIFGTSTSAATVTDEEDGFDAVSQNEGSVVDAPRLSAARASKDTAANDLWRATASAGSFARYGYGLEARDLRQEAALRVLEKAAYPGGGMTSGNARLIAFASGRADRRKRIRQFRRESALDLTAPQPEPHTTGINASQSAAVLQAILKKLDTDELRLIRWLYFANRRGRDYATAYGMTAVQVSRKHHSVLRKLRRVLAAAHSVELRHLI